MSLYYDMSGTWRTVRYVWTKVGGNWREVPQIYVKVNGAWYPVWEYEWVPSSWSSCSKTCGGGTQTRTLTCQRNDGFSYDNSYCEKFAKSSKPATSQSCNTQSCTESYGCSASVSSTSDGDGCRTETLSPWTGVFSSASFRNISNGGSPFYLEGSRIRGTFYNTTSEGTMCNIGNGCYVVSGGYKYYANTGTDSATVWKLHDDRWRSGDNGGDGCYAHYSEETCYPLHRDSV